MFNPYEQWLGIPKDKKPITYYLLLGVSPKEADADAIAAAADVQVAAVRPHRKGPHAEVAARVLKEIEHARGVLLDPAKRREYDAKLRKVAGAADEKPARAAAADDDDRPRKRPRREEKAKKKSALPLVLAGVGAVVLLAGGGVAAVLLLKDNKTNPTTPAVASQSQPTQPEPTPTTSAAAQATTAAATKPTPPAETKPAQPTPAAPTTPAAQPKPTPPAPPPPPPPPAPVKPAPPPVVKQPVPDAAALTKAEAALREEFKADYAKTQPKDRVALAAKFLQPGRENRKDPAAWFALLKEARDLATQAGRPRLAVEAIHEIDKWFVIDALDMMTQTLTAVSKDAKDEFGVAAAYRTAANLIQQAYDVDNYDAAKKLAEIAATAARTIKSADLVRLTQDQVFDVEQAARDFEAVKAARAKLAAAPNDPVANMTVGVHLCFFQGDWAKGLPLLAKCGDPKLKDPAAKELAQPADVKGRLAVADMWWNWAQLRKDRQQRKLFQHARAWYERAGPDTTGDDRATVVNRILDIQNREYARIARLVPGSFYGRDPENRALLLREGGGTMKSEEAVERGLEWLARHQASSGGWTTDAFHKVVPCRCTAASKDKHDVAGTAFALLPFLGAGETHRAGGKYSGVVQRGLAWLLAQQKPDGNFHDNAYENALATIVVVELYGLTKDQRLRVPAQAAVNYIVLTQDSGGSWGYSKSTKGDTSICGWQFTALKAAGYAKLQVPPDPFAKLSLFLDSVADANGLGYGYNAPGSGTSTSGIGILCREFLSWGPGHPGLGKSIDFLMRPENYPTRDTLQMYPVFYITQVAHHYGGPHWEKWNDRVRDLMIELQDKGDEKGHEHQKGSWSPYADPKIKKQPEGRSPIRIDQYAEQGGRIMMTSLALVTLQSYYYHIPLYAAGPYTLAD